MSPWRDRARAAGAAVRDGRAARWLGAPAAAPYVSWVVARVLAAGAFAVAVVVADELVPGARPTPLTQWLLAWDGAFYADIARHGYDSLPIEALRFFPLLPLLARATSIVFLGNVDVALVVVANGAALGAAVLLYRLVALETGDRHLASRAVWLLALFPAAFVLVLGYTEGPALALTVGAFLALRRRRWWWAAALGLLVGLSRPVGAALALPAAVEAVRGLRSASGRERAARLAAVASPLAGLLAYLAWVEVRFGAGMLPLRAHERADLRGDFVFPLVRVGQAAGDLVGGDRLGEGLHVFFVVAFAAALVVVFRTLPVSYGLYATTLPVVALSAESLGSFERYGLLAFPLFVGLASLTSNPGVDRPVVVLSGAGLTAFGSLVLLGVFVP